MIELIGTLALISLVAMLAAPSTVRRVQERRRREEAQMMENISDAFRRVVILHKTVPSTQAVSWAGLVAAELSLPEDLVVTNGSGLPRLLIYDPALNIGGRSPASLPFNQQTGGATNLSSPRLVIISALSPCYPPLDLATTSAFSNLWNRGEHVFPADWPENNAVNPDDLIVQRLDLTPLFHEVVLNNVDGFADAPYAVLTNSLVGAGHSNYVGFGQAPLSTRLIHGTPLRLYYSDGIPQIVTIVSGDASFAFENGRWNRRAQSGLNGPTTCGVLGTLVELFMNRPDWGATALGTTPESVVLGMFDMLCGCKDWADAGFENENGHSKWEAPTARFVFDIAPQLMLSSQDLINK